MVLFLSGASAALPQSTGFSHLRDAACLNEFCFCSCNSFNADGRSLSCEDGLGLVDECRWCRHLCVQLPTSPPAFVLPLCLPGGPLLSRTQRSKQLPLCCASSAWFLSASCQVLLPSEDASHDKSCSCSHDHSSRRWNEGWAAVRKLVLTLQYSRCSLSK